MSVVIAAGCAARSVSSAAAVALLSADGGTTFSTSGVALAGTSQWSLTVTTSQNINVKVYVGAGMLAGLVELTALAATVTSAAPLVISASGESGNRLYVTAQAVSATASVNADFRGVSP
jgi:pheromone shutdown protein TraB